MGTRHLIGVILDGDFRIAQYGQWDGYPSGQGVTVLDFCRSVKLEKFKDKVRGVRFATDEDQKSVDDFLESIGSANGWLTMEQSNQFQAKFPALSRDVGSDILAMVNSGSAEFLQDSRDFALDSLFCEWAYVLDLDTDTLEVYQGFQKSPHECGRWGGQKAEKSDYYPVKMVQAYSLYELPNDEDFVKELEGEEEDE